MRVQVPELVRLEERSSVLALASERSAIDVPRRSLGVQYLAGQGKQNLEKMDQEHWDLTLEVALHSPLLARENIDW